MNGYIHSFETFGTVDGPGVRFVVFFQGCPMRCLYCHNPDTWNINDGQQYSAEEIIDKIKRNLPFYTSGGITASGGEPMMQIDFLIELFELAKENNIHTCLDTSGAVYDSSNMELMEKIEKLSTLCDLVMLDIKHIDDDEHKKLTHHTNKNILEFAKFLDNRNVKLRIRHVIVPEITNKEEQLASLGKFLKDFKNIEKIEVLPYHTLGKAKYENMGMEYPLGDTPQLSDKDAKHALEIIRENMR